jgi:transcriptional antiterminator RfaH
MSRSQTSDRDSNSPKWYCLRSQPKHEHIAAAHLRMVEGLSVFCPRVRFQRPTRQGLASVTQAMFPGYLFASFHLETMQQQVRYAHGVSGIVQFGGRYPLLQPGVIDQLREYCGAAEIRELGLEISQGDKVKVLQGAFAELEAVVTQVIASGERVRILMDFLGRELVAEVETNSVRLETARPHLAV